MKVFFSILIMLCISIILFYLLNYGYYRGEIRNYNTVSSGDLTYYLNSLLRFDALIVCFNVLLLFSGYRVYSKVKSISSVVKLRILIIFYGLNIIDSFAFAINNYIVNHHKYFELNVFPVLLEKYGVIANLVYIAPLILSVVIFLVFLLFINKRMNKLS